MTESNRWFTGDSFPNPKKAEVGDMYIDTKSGVMHIYTGRVGGWAMSTVRVVDDRPVSTPDKGVVMWDKLCDGELPELRIVPMGLVEQWWVDEGPDDGI